MRGVATAAVLLVLAALNGARAKDNRSLTDFESGPSGQEITVPVSEDEDGSGTAEKLVLARNAIKALTESLVLANSEAEIFKRKAADLQLKVDAYGLSGLENKPEKIEQRLLAAVRDLRAANKQKDETVNQLVRLAEATQILLKTATQTDPQARAGVETELRKASEILGSPGGIPANKVEPVLTDAMVVDVKEDLSLVVTNIGAKHGVKIGMPFQVIRDNKIIGFVRVVDVREKISGAVIQNLQSEKQTVQSGDRLRVDAKQ